MTRYLDDDLCTPAGVRSINKGINEMQGVAEIKPILEYLEIEKIDIDEARPQYFTKYIEEHVNKIFNRVLILPLSIQTFFFRVVRWALSRERKIEDWYNPLKCKNNNNNNSFDNPLK